jgi:hypothetical protein
VRAVSHEHIRYLGHVHCVERSSFSASFCFKAICENFLQFRSMQAVQKTGALRSRETKNNIYKSQCYMPGALVRVPFDAQIVTQSRIPKI